MSYVSDIITQRNVSISVNDNTEFTSSYVTQLNKFSKIMFDITDDIRDDVFTLFETKFISVNSCKEATFVIQELESTDQILSLDTNQQMIFVLFKHELDSLLDVLSIRERRICRDNDVKCEFYERLNSFCFDMYTEIVYKKQTNLSTELSLRYEVLKLNIKNYNKSTI